jgi:mevalonate kinase
MDATLTGLRMGVETYSSPAKAILCGEHFVVYRGRAIACAIPKRAYATASASNDGMISIEMLDEGQSCVWRGDKVVKSSDRRTIKRLRPLKTMLDYIMERYGAKGFKLRIKSEIPRGMGLGSSASVSLAAASACLSASNIDPTPTVVTDVASVAESVIHYRASGIDLAVSLHGGVISFIRGEKPSQVPIGYGLELLLVSTERGRRTGEMVKRVGNLREQFVSIFDKLLAANDEICSEMELALSNQRLERVGHLLVLSHNLLRTIGVSNKQLDLAVESAMEAGALGAKLTGAGGGGYVIAIPAENKAREVAQALQDRFRVEVVRIPHEGLRREETAV